MRDMMCCEGHFLGLTVCSDTDLETSSQSTVYEYDADADEDASEFNDMMRNLGAVGLLEKFVHTTLLPYYQQYLLLRAAAYML